MPPNDQGAARLPDLPHPDAILGRRAVAEALTAAGYPTAKGTLDVKACSDDGPPFRKFGHVALYRWRDALEWAESRTRAPTRRNVTRMPQPQEAA